MVSAYLPIDAQYGCKDEVVPYVPALTAEAYGKVAGALGLPDNIVKDFEMKVCNISSVKRKRFHKPNKDYPVALFSPGYQGSRLVYGAMARSLASLGYIILTVDHTYEAFVVEFPDGTAATAAELPDNMNSTYRQLEVSSIDIDRGAGRAIITLTIRSELKRSRLSSHNSATIRLWSKSSETSPAPSTLTKLPCTGIHLVDQLPPSQPNAITVSLEVSTLTGRCTVP
jgi:hypothetical protein